MSFEPFTLQDFLDESNRIEGMGPADASLLAEADRFLGLARVEIDNLIAFVKVAQPNAVIRDMANDDPFRDPYYRHVQYETLHPFTDGNGRSGRILWLWMMGGIEEAPLGFLHHWYYQSLQHSRGST